MEQSEVVFFFSAKTQHENLGDAVINRELLRELVKIGKVEMNNGGMPATFLDFIKVPSILTHQNGLSFFSKLISTSLQSLLHINKKQIYYVLNPGGFSGGVSGSGYIRQYFLVFMYAFLKAINVKVIRLGASAGPYTNARLCIEKMKSALMYKNTVRDPVSYDYVLQKNFKKIEMFPDWAYMLKKLGARNQYNDKLNAVLSFRSENKITGYDEAINNTLTRILACNTQFQQYSWATVSQVEFDVERNAQLAQWLKSMSLPVTEYSGLSELDYFAIYHSAQYVFSNRLHVLLFALRQGAVAYAVVDPAVNTKIVGIYRDMGLAELIIDINNLPSEIKLVNQAVIESQIDKVFSLKQKEISDKLKALLQVE